MTISLKILYQDNSLLVLDKPPGLVVDPAKTVKGETLMDWLRFYYDTSMYPSKNIPERMGLIHRLDKDTSGVILVAKTKEALENLQKQFKERKVKKEYLALVHGSITEGGVVEAAIGRNPANREKFTVLTKGVYLTHPKGVQNGREAVTEYEPMEKFQIPNSKFQIIFNDLNKIQMRKLERMNYNRFTLVKCHPRTGRTHQIRVHLKYIGYPVVADEKYGGRKMVRLDKRWCPRMFLHAMRIGFYHPMSGKWMELKSELPEDLKKVIKLLSN